MKRGDVYWADLNPRSGSEQRGIRPVIVISHDGFNENPRWRSIIVVPLSTSESQGRRGQTTKLISASITGLDRDSIALCHQITTLDRAKLTRKIAELPVDVLFEIEDGIKAATDML